MAAWRRRAGGDDFREASCTGIIRGFRCNPVILVLWVLKVPYKVRYPGDEFSRKEVRQCSSVELIGVRLGEAEHGLCRVLIYRAERGCYHEHSARPKVSLCWTRDLFNAQVS